MTVTPIRPGVADAPPVEQPLGVQEPREEHACCEGCFIVGYGKWEVDPASPQDPAKYLKSCPRPLMQPRDQILQCCICGGPTIVGIFMSKSGTELPCKGIHDPNPFGPGNSRGLKRS